MKRIGGSDLGPTAAPLIVREVLRSTGQPLEQETRASMESRFGHDFGRIRIHTDPPAARASAALGAEAFTIAHHIAFAPARFLPGTEHGKRLLAHELTHAIQQAATSPHIALSPDKKRAAPAPGRSVVAGEPLGWNQNNDQVQVKREVGGTEGYDGRLQAIAVARLAKAEPAAVVQDANNKKWHAVETTADFESGPSRTARSAMEASAGEDTRFLAVYGLPSLSRIAQSRQKVDELKAQVARLDALEADWSDPEFRKAVRGASEATLPAIQAERKKTIQNLNQATQTHAALILGVPESEILLSRSLTGREAGKVNIIGTTRIGTHLVGGKARWRGTGIRGGTGVGLRSIDLSELDKARAARGAVSRGSHQIDWDLPRSGSRKYTTETKRCS